MRLIDADELMEEIEKLCDVSYECGCCPFGHGKFCTIRTTILGVTTIEPIKELRTADRPMGEWRVVATTKPMYDRMGVLCWGSVYKCDQCDFTTWAVEGHFSQYNFCPNCGAYMKGGDNE